MPRGKKPKPTKRADGRYVCRYKNQYFYSTDPDDCIRQREEYKEAEKKGMVAVYFVREYALQWLERSFPNVTPSTKQGLKTHLQKLIDSIGDLPISEVKPSYIKSIYTDHYAGLSNSYIKAGKQLFCALFDSAVADGLILSNPARDKTAKPHTGTKGGHRSITPQERDWILRLCTDHRAHPVVMAMLYRVISHASHIIKRSLRSTKTRSVGNSTREDADHSLHRKTCDKMKNDCGDYAKEYDTSCK